MERGTFDTVYLSVSHVASVTALSGEGIGSSFHSPKPWSRTAVLGVQQLFMEQEMLFREFRQLEPAALAVWTKEEFWSEKIKLII